MNRHTPRTHGRRARLALSVTEVMISLAITSMLLTAIAAAFQSSTAVIAENDEFFRATQAARVALNQMLTEVRRSESIDDDPTAGIQAKLLPIWRPDETRPANEDMRYYEFQPADGTRPARLCIYFKYKNGTTSPKYTLAEHIQAAPFDWEMGKDAGGLPCVARVTVALDVKVGRNTIHLSGSAAPRRSVSYQ